MTGTHRGKPPPDGVIRRYGWCHHDGTSLHLVRHIHRALRHRVERRGIVAIQLPESRSGHAGPPAEEHRNAAEGVPPAEIQRALEEIVSLMAGEASDLSTSCSTWCGAAFSSAGVRSGARHPAGRDDVLRRARGTAGSAGRRARGRTGAGTQSIRDRGTLPPRAGRRRQAGRVLGQRRRQHQAAPAGDRARQTTHERHGRPADRGSVGFDRGAAVAHLRAPIRRWRRSSMKSGRFACGRSHVQPVRRAGRGDRLSAADRQGGGHHLRAGARAVPGAHEELTPLQIHRAPRPSCAPPDFARQAAVAARSGGARRWPVSCRRWPRCTSWTTKRSSSGSRRCAASAAGPSRCC